MEKALIVIDFQHDFVDGSLGSDEALMAAPKIIAKINGYKQKGLPVIFTKDTHGDDYLSTPEGVRLPVPHCIKDTKGWQLYNDKYFDSSFIVLHKELFGFLEWETILDNPWEIEIIGLATDICVITNALILKTLYPKAKITVDSACCGGTTLENHLSALAVMRCCQIDVV